MFRYGSMDRSTIAWGIRPFGAAKPAFASNMFLPSREGIMALASLRVAIKTIHTHDKIAPACLNHFRARLRPVSTIAIPFILLRLRINRCGVALADKGN